MLLFAVMAASVWVCGFEVEATDNKWLAGLAALGVVIAMAALLVDPTSGRHAAAEDVRDSIAKLRASSEAAQPAEPAPGLVQKLERMNLQHCKQLVRAVLAKNATATRKAEKELLGML